ncbi:MAG TPA: hypothetical protein VN622_01620 [Clostridia bacterium]|nr:hypothetical protein [Clostridia bacterium]
MRRGFLLCFIIFLLSSLLFAQAAYRLKTRTASELAAGQRQVVGAYCRSDFEGLRLSENGWAKMRPLTRDMRNPEFSAVMIVSRYTFAPPAAVSKDVAVTYSVIGRYEVGFGFTPLRATPSAIFHVEDVDGDLVITEMPSTPYVSKGAALSWLKAELVKAQPSTLHKAQLERAIAAMDQTAPAHGPGAATAPATAAPK